MQLTKTKINFISHDPSSGMQIEKKRRQWSRNQCNPGLYVTSCYVWLWKYAIEEIRYWFLIIFVTGVKRPEQYTVYISNFTLLFKDHDRGSWITITYPCNGVQWGNYRSHKNHFFTISILSGYRQLSPETAWSYNHIYQYLYPLNPRVQIEPSFSMTIVWL